MDESLIEPLTRREKEVLALLADDRLSNQEIAGQLTISPNSLKWYTHQIYQKFGVKSRRQAVIKARELAMLPTEKISPMPPAHHLPILLTSFLGRENQVDQIRRMLLDQGLRLVTLTGAGGVGKTRLAIRVAEQVKDCYPHGVWLVELAGLTNEQFIADSIAAVFALKGSQDHDTATVLREYLRNKHLLLVLDNCEHLIDACAALVEALLQSCQNLQFLVTSREALNIEGEVPFVVPSLSFPDSSNYPPDQDQLYRYEAVRLFIERATAAQPNFELTFENARAITRICQKLDGIPLALELAAARLKVIDVFQLADLLEESFHLLAGGSRTSLARHKTMRASIEWSYNLLTEAEQRLLQHLSVFAGGWTLEAAEAVFAGEAERDANVARGKRGMNIVPIQTRVEQIVELLSGLVDKSLIAFRSSAENRPRYTILETVRQYAQERLIETGGREAIRDRHLDYFLQLGEQAGEEITGPKQIEWVFRLEEELGNLRLALEWSLAGRIEDGMRLGSALMWFWHYRNHYVEGVDWLQKLLKAADTRIIEEIPLLLTWIRARNAASFLAIFTYQTHTIARYDKFLDDTIHLCRSIGRQAEQELSWALIRRGARYATEGEYHQAERQFTEALAICRRNHQHFVEAHCLFTYGYHFRMDQPKCNALFAESLSILESLGSTETDLGVTVRHYLAIYSIDEDSERRKRWFAECLRYYSQIGNFVAWAGCATWLYYRFPEPENLAAADIALAYMLNHEPEIFRVEFMTRAEAEWSLGHYERAESIAREVLHMALMVNNITEAASAQALITRCATGQGDLEHLT